MFQKEYGKVLKKTDDGLTDYEKLALQCQINVDIGRWTLDVAPAQVSIKLLKILKPQSASIQFK